MASDKVKLLIHTTDHSESKEIQPKAVRRLEKRKSMQERLLRNSCIACALLLGILALGNTQHPWAVNTSAAIERALTMEIDLDQSLGQLSFVQKLMPESALVFFNLNGKNEFMRPVQGELEHSFSGSQPWLMFHSEPGASVCAIHDGTVSAISPMSSGGYGMLIDHGNGIESITAGLAEVNVSVGAAVVKGGVIGTSDGSIYFELRESGSAADPTERMGL